MNEIPWMLIYGLACIVFGFIVGRKTQLPSSGKVEPGIWPLKKAAIRMEKKMKAAKTVWRKKRPPKELVV